MKKRVKQARPVKQARGLTHKKGTIRVAAAQFAAGVDVEANLKTCLHWIREAGKCKPDLLVLPEFVNHASWYDDKAHCHRVSVDLDGPFVKAIAEAAREINSYVVVNCTLRREAGQNSGPTCSGTSILISPAGEVLSTNDKQVLIGHENDFLRRSTQHSPIVKTPLGRLGLYACMDGVIAETPRMLALRGAQILCNSLNSFATDEGSLHIPVRAAENRVFIVAANKVGALIPEALLEPVSQQTGIPVKFLSGAGDSQIVAPDGTVLAIASSDKPEVIWADIDLAAWERKRPDGTDVIRARRPELYAPIGQDPAKQPEPAFTGAAELKVAAIQLPGTGEGALDAAVAAVKKAAAQGAKYIVLPENFAPHASAADIVKALSAAAGDARIAASCYDKGSFTAVLIDRTGVVLRQPLIHRSQRHRKSKLGKSLATLKLGDAHVAVLCGDDAIYPEVGRLLAMKGVDLLLVPLAPQEAWELRTGLVERAAENRFNLVAACQPGPLGTSLVCALQKDFTVMTPWHERPFDGLLSQPILTRAAAHPGVTVATVYPANAANKVVSRGTDLVRGRAWHLAKPITQRSAAR